MGISGGMVRLKGNSPKVSTKDQNRPRTLKQYGGSQPGIGNVGLVGPGSMGQGYVRNI
jgi:hypothetical protein